MNRKEKTRKLREQVATTRYNSVCSVCQKKKKTMQFHHKKYRNGELTHRDFKNNSDYQYYVLPIIERRPHNFEYLCRGCHWQVTRYSKNKKTREQLERITTIVRETVAAS